MSRSTPNTGADPDRFFARAEALLSRLEQWLPPVVAEPDWEGARAFHWRKRGGRGLLEAVPHPHRIRLSDLQGIDEQKKQIDRNTRQFVAGFPANHVLLTGARGTGKSSLVKAVFGKYAKQGLRLIEVGRHDLADLPEISDLLYRRPERFLLYCDDLTFEANEPGYKALKVALDGTISGVGDNVLVYATSNRRHLLPDYMAENLATQYLGEEVHPGESVEEKVALSERFGVWLSFYPFDQDEYLSIVNGWLAALGAGVHDGEAVRREALQWALTRGARNGRIAWQFARDFVGRQGIKAAR